MLHVENIIHSSVLPEIRVPYILMGHKLYVELSESNLQCHLLPQRTTEQANSVQRKIQHL